MCEYKWISIFQYGLASVCKNDKWGYRDKTGKELLFSDDPLPIFSRINEDDILNYNKLSKSQFISTFLKEIKDKYKDNGGLPFKIKKELSKTDKKYEREVINEYFC